MNKDVKATSRWFYNQREVEIYSLALHQLEGNLSPPTLAKSQRHP